ncbi:sulfite exporter TauE/SafE family protein [Roseivirga sp.]|uniref:sulfite exporter TauE/SafE family protein n=1 Tax=Roseivirga sp. TaxID=1964215 RepID=UPI003B8B4111
MLLATAIAFGFLGSLHCLGMCAPLLWAMPEDKAKRSVWWRNKLLYNFGRILTYGLLGLMIGLVGEGISFIGWQQHLSWITGVVLILGLSLTIWEHKLIFFKSFSVRINEFVRKGVSKSFRKHNAKSQFIFGLFNGLLPCGLVYMALIASLSMETIGGSILYMVLFGLGTIPMMIGAAILKQSIKSMKGFSFNKFYPKIVFTIALLLIIRGMNLGIPYLSPKSNSIDGITVCETE